MFLLWTGHSVLPLDVLLALNSWSDMTLPCPLGSYYLDTIDPIPIHLPASDSPFTLSPTAASHQLLI